MLSGYLITSLLIAEHGKTGSIDLPQFWVRRAKRLLPALLLVLVAVLFRVNATAPPFELSLRRQDLLWTLFYGSNWHFIASAQDYFAQYASVSPVRHTWSLAIEEQFYLAWPLIVLGALTVGRGRLGPAVAVCGAGILMSAAAMTWLFDPGDPSRAYYGTDSRIHQPLIGALLAMVSSGRLPRSIVRAAPVCSVVGAAGLALSAVFLSDRWPIYWNGLSVVLALSGALLIFGIEMEPKGGLARLLSCQPFRWIGQISYGLYLWHWPVILALTVLPASLRWLPGSLGTNLARVVVTFAIATASYYVLERPVRLGRVPLIGRSVPRFAAGMAVAVASVAMAIFWGARASTEYLAAQDIPGCPPSGDSVCVRLEGPRGAPVLAVTGDSIARSLDPAFMKLAREHNWTYLLAAKNACRITRLLTSYEGQVRSFDQQCYETTPRVTRRLLRWRPSTIVAMDRWEIMDFVRPDGKTLVRGTPEHVRLTQEALEDVAREFTSAGGRLVFLELPPALNSDCGGALPLSSPACNVPVASDLAQAPYNRAFEQVGASVPGVTAISITDALCPNGICVSQVNGLTLRFDGLHFSPAASLWLAPTLYGKMVAAGVAPG